MQKGPDDFRAFSFDTADTATQPLGVAAMAA
jgi:hypothetical protein